MTGTVFVLIVLFIIAVLLFTGSSLMDLFTASAGQMQRYRDAADRRRQQRAERYDEYVDDYEEDDGEYYEDDGEYFEDEYDREYAGASLTRPVSDAFASRRDRNRRRTEERENDRILSGNRKVRGVHLQTILPPEETLTAGEEMPAAEEEYYQDQYAQDEAAAGSPEAGLYESNHLHEILPSEDDRTYSRPERRPAAGIQEIYAEDTDTQETGDTVLTPATEIVIHRGESLETVTPYEEDVPSGEAAWNGGSEKKAAETEGFTFVTPETHSMAKAPEEAQVFAQTAQKASTAPTAPTVPEKDTVRDAGPDADAADITVHRDRGTDKTEAPGTGPSAVQAGPAGGTSVQPKKQRAPYVFPPMDLLKRGKRRSDADTDRELKETALQLEETLRTFGVNVTITDISQGPAVTRYELLPEQGVKVSRILSLQDDIKMHLAATDIRIEAPIPGKAAIGIEVPNKENSVVSLRDVIETPEYQNFKGKLAFPVGKDIAGQPVVFDIAKMPHVLIAGATGSGKSVCINTIIMGLLYKTTPEECKLIMIDPKIVELSVYNGIPHLMIPVVTDPKKAAAALAWAVAEMTERYGKFAAAKVRDLKGYNEKMLQLKESGEDPEARPIPQLVIIVDELADLMMVSANEVEEAICRLAQLARAAGIHLIIATQRPSVDVITGLIKANMPSRVAFAVSSGVDSRTILDMVGAEKLLGKGDMLFYPQGYPKPARVQGAFVSDDEVGEVVSYIRDHNQQYEADEDIDSRIDSITRNGQSISAQGQGQGASDNDELFAEAGKFIIEKQKASIGLLQRAFKIGFNRAARIMDQLAEAGVVSEEEGTKARTILMDMVQFNQYLEEQ
ncbi:MAG: DNA translocase FtsK [Lachnospiraceae bacterium]|nr:DNA translocase FtsK [Lachnospiraceae bacterium]